MSAWIATPNWLFQESYGPGGDAFTEYSLPEAILKLRQGVGRLIRTKSDHGIVVILDNRIVTRPYGRAFLQALPECPVKVI
jgi:ATP-dependent DNA helicase DinG